MISFSLIEFGLTIIAGGVGAKRGEVLGLCPRSRATRWKLSNFTLGGWSHGGDGIGIWGASLRR